MSSSDKEEWHDTLKDYTIVHFIKRGRQSKVRTMDIVPTKWLGFSKQKGRCVTKFPDASSEPEDIQLLHDFVQSLADAPEAWKEYTVDIKGRADTYKEALEKFEALKGSEHALTDIDLKQQMEEDIKRRQLSKGLEKLKLRLQQSFTNKLDDVQEDQEAYRASSAAPQDVDSHPCTDNSEASTGITHKPQDKYDSSPGNSDMESKENSPKPKRKRKHNHDSTCALKNALISNLVPLTTDKPSTSTVGEGMIIEDTVDNESKSDKVNCKFGGSSLISSIMNSKPKNFDHQKHSVQNNLGMIADLSLPVINLSSVQCKSDFETAVLGELIMIRQELQMMRTTQEDTTNYLIDKELVKTKEIDFNRKYNFQLPISEKDKFVQFNEALKTNKFLKNDVCAALTSCVDRDFVITKSYLSMLKAFITKDVALRYTAARKSQDKENPKDQMKPTELYKCMESIILTARNQKNLHTPQKDLVSSLSDVLSNVRQWKTK